MLLDYYYAAQAGWGRDDRLIESLATSGVNKRTSSAGCYSFTTILILVMSRMLEEQKCFRVRELYTRLAKQVEKDEKVQETLVYISLTGREKSIILRPINRATNIQQLLRSSPLLLISIRISLSQKSDRPAPRRLERWLKTATPRII